MSLMFGTKRLTDDCQIQTSPCFEGRCDCPPASRMEDQSPTPPLSRPGSSILITCDQDLASPPEPSALWTASNGIAFKREDESHHFASDLQRALNNVDANPQSPEEDLRQYITSRDIQPPFYRNSPRQYFPYPQYEQQPPSYVSYSTHPFGPLSPSPTIISESPLMNQFPQTCLWPTPQELCRPFDDPRGDAYIQGSHEEEEEETMCDKPYARLIYDALMQAPGHRMMLKEIYEWFQRHTTKPAESGTNGWQNSIRHNLSMNQAFENDKSDQTNAPGQKQKVNSVWILTENAIRNGVQSTTRYRKNVSGKRVNNNRTPAPLRQRSGAKGGRAAKRAASLRKKEHPIHHDQLELPLEYPLTSMYDYEGSTCDGAESSDAFSILDPTTPAPDFSFGSDPSYQPPRFTIGQTSSPMYRSSNPTSIDEPDQGIHDYGYHPTSDVTLENMLRAHHDSTASNLPTALE